MMMADALKRRGAAAQPANSPRLRKGVTGGLSQSGTELMPRSSSSGSLVSTSGSHGVKVTFVVPKNVPYGQSLALVGHGRELGSWQPSHAVSMRWSEGDVWTTELDLPPGKHEFKCVAVTPEGELLWQPGSNRVIQVPADVDAALEAHCDWYGSTKTLLVPCTSNTSNDSAMSEEECLAYTEDMSEDATMTLPGMLSPSDSFNSAGQQGSITANMAAMAMELEQQDARRAAPTLEDEPSVAPPRLQQLQQSLAAGRSFAPGTLSLGGRRSTDEGRGGMGGSSGMASPTSDVSTDDMMDAFVSASSTPFASVPSTPTTVPTSPSSEAAAAASELPADLVDLAHSVLAAGLQAETIAVAPAALDLGTSQSSQLRNPFAAASAKAVTRPVATQAAAVVTAPLAAPAAAPSRHTPKRADRALRMVSGAHMIPHVNKVATGGEDAYFISAAAGAIGVSDGVSAWAEDGIDPGDYSRTLMAYCCEAMDASAPLPGTRAPSKAVDPRAVLKYAQRCTMKHGSATAVLAVLQPGGKLVVANLGDCGVKVVRGRQIALSTQPQQHEFNLPYQLSHPRLYPETDDADSADRYSFNVQAGDVIIAGSDGLFDNLWDDEMLALIEEAGLGPEARGDGGSCDDGAAEKLAKTLAAHAHKNAADKDYRSPWSVAAGREAGLLARLFAKGGKMDDVCCVVSIVQ